MRTALADNDPLDCLATARAGLAGASKDLQLVSIAALMFGNRIKIGFTGSQRSSQISEAAFKHPPDGSVKHPNFSFRQRGGHAAGVNPRFPERLINVNIAESGDEGLIQQQRF
jgi:hypothetical protein